MKLQQMLFLDVYETVSEISYAVLCCLPTYKLTTFTYRKFDSKYLLFLKLAKYQFPRISSQLDGMSRPKEIDRQDGNL